MNRREKILLLVVGSAVALFICYLLVTSLFIGELRRQNDRKEELAKQIEQTRRDKDRDERVAARLPELLDRTFGSDVNLVSDSIGKRLGDLLAASGLKTGISLSPGVSRKIRTANNSDIAADEVTWQVTTEGALDQVIDFLYLLDAEPYMHRVENLTLTPNERTGVTGMRLRFLSLVPTSLEKGKDLPAGKAAQDFPDGLLGGEKRKVYEVIAQRDAFRPYVKYIPPPESPQPRPQPVRPEPAVAAAPPPRQKIVALSTWAGQQEVDVKNIANGKVEALKQGEPLAGGQIVMIDYRMMKMPGKDEDLSPSRVIVRKGDDYWAIELGQEVSSARLLPQDELPAELATE
jgi:hypothetical protein